MPFFLQPRQQPSEQKQSVEPGHHPARQFQPAQPISSTQQLQSFQYRKSMNLIPTPRPTPQPTTVPPIKPSADSSAKSFEIPSAKPSELPSAKSSAIPSEKSFTHKTSPNSLPQWNKTMNNQRPINTNMGIQGSLQEQTLNLMRNLGPSLFREFGPPIARHIGPPLARRIGPPLAQKVALPVAKKIGIPLAKRVCLPLVKKLGGLILTRIGF